MEAGIWVIAMCMVVITILLLYEVLFGEDEDGLE